LRFIAIDGYRPLTVTTLGGRDDTLVRQLSAPDFQFVWPPFVLAFVVLGILLVALALSTIYCAMGVRRGERWAWRLGISNALTVLSLPIVLWATLGQEMLHLDF
jgi:hypothetical protein